MRWTLRLVAAWLAFTGVTAVIIAARHAEPLLLRTGLAPALLLGLLGAAVLSAVASVQLWRLREWGRRAALVMCVFWGGLWVWCSGRRLSVWDAAWVLCLTLATAIVGQRSAHRVCQ